MDDLRTNITYRMRHLNINELETHERIGYSPMGYLTAQYIWICIIGQQTTDLLLRDWLFCDYNEHR
ncbi:18689_t:CDS:2 [Funneliformis geosporum]|uniref:18689_t:CDS:1 n=1 Tax=Funneliformis geosporum TaxID=1117311 RepID=A0A9W4SHX8_9GLOM|nr:18689_t:CDS:2 [Funneliformis geosporum]